MDLNLEEGADSTDSQFNGCLNVGFEASSKFGFSGPLAALLGAPSGSTGTVFQTSTPNLFQVSSAFEGAEHHSYAPFTRNASRGRALALKGRASNLRS